MFAENGPSRKPFHSNGRANGPHAFYDSHVNLTSNNNSHTLAIRRCLEFAAGNPLSARAALQSDFDAVFANITHFSITGEFINDGDNFDTVGLDNVVLQAVPIPPSLPLLLGALVGVIVTGRRQR